jgi:hypothetical protein
MYTLPPISTFELFDRFYILKLKVYGHMNLLGESGIIDLEKIVQFLQRYSVEYGTIT